MSSDVALVELFELLEHPAKIVIAITNAVSTHISFLNLTFNTST